MSALQTLDRGLEAIEIISQRTSGISPASLADELGVHRAGAYRILSTLERRHLVAKGSDGLYRLGSGALVVAGRFMSQYRSAAQPVVQELADRSGFTAFVSIADRAESVALAVAEPAARGSIGISYQVGARHPLEEGADGLAILAQRPERPTDSEAVRRSRAQGYALSDGEVQPGTVGLAVGTGGAPTTNIEASIGVVRLGLHGDLDIDQLLPLVQSARDAVVRLH
ncbi:helix-turn-helix domain-containing protein [Aeromicrobium sp.]|uniref:IclR family transcriptional regulator n=1 Tax=Aeromicrobium sp. TaxID=1871063 RepID=UPI00199AAFFA|nr:helix-turn-helix domain-containing protein [Aeromicrobium sp.]MBC7632290.1 helix-turn-helix domain-containing protein [Aeromicrobium sp.]